MPDRLHWDSLITTMFLHGGWMHVMGNMWFLWITEDNIEDIMGRGDSFCCICCAAWQRVLLHVFFNPYSRVPTVGASGAIAGVMGAYLIKFPHARIITLVPLFIFITTLEIPAVFVLLYWFVIQFFSGIGSIGYSHVSSGGVAWFAHVGGFIAGMLLMNGWARDSACGVGLGMKSLDILAIAAHPDDVEQTCGGNPCPHGGVGLSHRSNRPDRGEMGTRGTRNSA